MARLRPIPVDVARQALVNKALDEQDLREAFAGDPVTVDVDELELLATDVGVPEMVPYEYVYVDVYTDGDEAFFLDVNETVYRRSSTKSLQQQNR